MLTLEENSRSSLSKIVIPFHIPTSVVSFYTPKYMGVPGGLYHHLVWADVVILMNVQSYLLVVVVRISTMINGAEHLLRYLHNLLGNICSKTLLTFL